MLSARSVLGLGSKLNKKHMKMKTYIKFTKEIELNTISEFDGNNRTIHFLSDGEYEVEHIKDLGNNHVSIWLKHVTVIIPRIFNNMSIFTIVKKY